MTIAVDPVRDDLFLVTWTELDKTTVVHLEDYRRMRIVTNITDPKDGLMRFAGTYDADRLKLSRDGPLAFPGALHDHNARLSGC